MFMRIGWFGFIIGFVALLYGGLWWYGKDIHPMQYGISFSSQHAAWLFSDWKKMYHDMLVDLKPPFIRLSVDWDQVEKKEGVYDFSDIDFMMNEAKGSGTKVVLAIGQKTPRWPECHIPAWVLEKTSDEYAQKLFTYLTATVDRYKNHPALEYWQVENEPYIKFTFGNCEKFQKDILDQEITIVRSHDSSHHIVITDSGELAIWYPAAKKGDIFGTTMYRSVMSPRGSVFTYDWLPAGWYRARAQVLGLSSDTFFISELQVEPWIHDGSVTSTPLEEQFKTMSVEQMKKNFEFARHTTASRAYLWGVEWWYWMKYEKGDNSFVELAKKYVTQN